MCFLKWAKFSGVHGYGRFFHDFFLLAQRAQNKYASNATVGQGGDSIVAARARGRLTSERRMTDGEGCVATEAAAAGKAHSEPARAHAQGLLAVQTHYIQYYYTPISARAAEEEKVFLPSFAPSSASFPLTHSRSPLSGQELTNAEGIKSSKRGRKKVRRCRCRHCTAPAGAHPLPNPNRLPKSVNRLVLGWENPVRLSPIQAT